MRVVVPFGADRPKTRLAPVLDADERRGFAEAMLRDVLAALDELGYEPTVVADAADDALVGTVEEHGGDVTVDERSLTAAVDARLPSEGAEPVAVVMADLALATPASLSRLFEPDADVVLAPGLGGGTNAVVVRHPDFRVDYHGASIRDHLAIAREVGASVVTVDSFRLAADVDEPVDLAEVLLHAEGDATAWLRDAGFAVAATGGRVEATRT